MVKNFVKLGTIGLTAFMLTQSAYAGKLIINADTADPAPKQAWLETIEAFKAENPDIEVQFNISDHEAYKTAIRGWLASDAPDVVFWYAGNRMNTFAERGLLEDVSDIWTDELKENFASTLSSMTYDGKQYGIPYTFYQWGIYYRKDLFEQVGIEGEPKTWDEFLQAGEKLKAAGITPVTIGTKYLWTAAGWFDYLDLRINGLEFHLQLCNGEISWKDPRVLKVFEAWKQLLDNGFFIENHANYSWQEAQPPLYNGQAAMYLIGNFITPSFPEDVKDNMGFFQFPVIDETIGLAEDAPTDTVHIPTKAKNKEDARRFLEYVARQDVQEKLNSVLLQIPTHKKAKAISDPFIDKGVAMLGSVEGTAQFYDRDTDPDMAKIGMVGFQEFMVKPERLDKILDKLEKARIRIYDVK
ncbi:MAG: ABC transporter substrate-binding protein [Alphaproteobacteria bacterium]